MTIKTLLKYLCGNRQAVLEIAGQPKLLWVGLLFVLSAGFAREYDQEDLWQEPWYLLIPLGASLLASLFLYGFLREINLARTRDLTGFQYSYSSFLKLFWMTAPLAWFYAIPVERFLSLENAVITNLCLLSFVSVWRILLISRVVSVIYHCSFFAALSVVMLFVILSIFAVSILSLFFFFPMLNIMGGIPLFSIRTNHL